jgi:hypothetical protein
MVGAAERSKLGTEDWLFVEAVPPELFVVLVDVVVSNHGLTRVTSSKIT